MITRVIGTVILVSSFVVAQGGPKCALKCYGMESRTCGKTDSACRCRDNKLIDSTAICLLGACPESQIDPAAQAMKAFCSDAGVPLIIPEQCALRCYGLDDSSCNKSDHPCRCGDRKLMNSMFQCIHTACPAGNRDYAIQLAKEFCSVMGAPTSLSSGSSIVSGSATPTVRSLPITGSSSTTPAETSPAQITEEAVSQNANEASPRNINVVAGAVAVGLVALMI